MSGRRELTFASLDDAVRDAEHLLAAGYDRAGNWDLAQVCGHLSEWMRYPMDGFPKAPLPIRAMLAVVRATMGRRMLAKYLRDGMPAGKPTLPQSVAAPGGDPAAAVARLRETVERMKAFPGEPKPSPLFGPLTRDAWFGVNRLHCGHHLSFLVPKG